MAFSFEIRLGFKIAIYRFKALKKDSHMLRESFRLSYSHSIVAGGLDVISYSTRLTWSTSFTIRTEIFSSTS